MHYGGIERIVDMLAKLGGYAVKPDGPLGFHSFRRLIGWRLVRLVQRAAENSGLNGVG